MISGAQPTAKSRPGTAENSKARTMIDMVTQV
jgi:hypothetical protein